MEGQQDSLFGMSIDPQTRSNLSETARWAQFLAIIGLIGCVLFVIAGVVMMTTLNTITNDPYYNNSGGNLTAFAGSVGIVFYILTALLIFFPCLFMLRFSGKMKGALAANDQVMLNSSFQNLKLLFRFWGIITIIVIAIYVLVFVAFGTGWLMGTR